jgi:hypothetical protein
VLKHVTLRVTTDGSGNGITTSSIHGVQGVLLAIEWVKGTLANGVDAVVSCVNTPSGIDQDILSLTDANSNGWYYPRSIEHNLLGAEQEPTVPPIINGDLKLTVASGGSLNSGHCVIYYVD